MRIPNLLMIGLMILGGAVQGEQRVVVRQDRFRAVPIYAKVKQGKPDADNRTGKTNYNEDRSIQLGNKWDMRFGRGLLRIDMSGLKVLKGRDIDSVQIRLPYDQTSNDKPVIGLYALSERNGDWKPGEATWNQKREGSKWVGKAGAGRALDSLVATSDKLKGSGSATFDIPAEHIEDWLNGKNFGLLLAVKGEGHLDVFADRESEDDAPEMVIEGSWGEDSELARELEQAKGVSAPEEVSEKKQDRPGVVVRDRDIKNGVYVYQLTYGDMGKGQTKFTDDLFSYENLHGDNGILREFEFPRAKPAGSDERDRFISHEEQVERAEFVYKFNFSRCSYRPVAVAFREKLMVTDRTRQDIRGTVEVRTDNGDWKVLRQHRSGESYDVAQENTVEDLDGADAVYYRVRFEALEDDADGLLNGYHSQWNRLPGESFRAKFKMKKVD